MYLSRYFSDKIHFFKIIFSKKEIHANIIFLHKPFLQNMLSENILLITNILRKYYVKNKKNIDTVSNI